MNRKILIQVTAPAVVIGLLLFAACLIGARYLNRLQENRSKIVYEHLLSMEAAQELEILVRQLRWHCFLYLVEPAPERDKGQRLQTIEQVHRDFEKSLDKARRFAQTEEERALVRAIETGYHQYRDELADLRDEFNHAVRQPIEISKLDVIHPIRHVVDPCREYFRVNKESLDQTNQDSNLINRSMRGGMLLLGLGGPISGLIIGYGMARGLSHSIYQLRVRVNDIAQRLDQNVASVSLSADGDFHLLDQQIESVVHRVAEVTERLQQQQHEMLRAEQLSAVGQLAASVAHEVRNPLTSVKLLVSAALRARDSKPLTREDLQVIHDEVLRLEQTVRGFLDFARPSRPCRSVCDLHDLALSAADLIRPHARQCHVELIVRGPEVPLEVDVDRGQISTVLVNLFLNALDAMPEGGRLDVDVERVEQAPPLYRLRVSDTGIGIPVDILPRLFTPFVSSKPTGTGLGLSICRRIIDEHGGKIAAANQPAGGACFVVMLPGLKERNHQRSSAVSGQLSRVK